MPNNVFDLSHALVSPVAGTPDLDTIIDCLQQIKQQVGGKAKVIVALGEIGHVGIAGLGVTNLDEVMIVAAVGPKPKAFADLVAQPNSTTPN